MVTNREKILELDSLLQKMTRDFNYKISSILPPDITPAQFFLLLQIKNKKDCKAADIAQCIDISPAAASHMVDRLYKNDWIDKTRSDEDRRVVWLKLSEKGEEILKDIEAKKLRLFVEGFENITNKELDFLIDIIKKILKVKN